MPLLSVIIPVYNVEQYIKECFDSIVIQIKDADVEIICIDDGSTDKSGAICDEYASKYNKIKVYHQKNKGVAAARNYGLSIAKGKYIAWIDPDDYVSEDWYEKISNVLIYKKTDILFFDYVLLKNGNLKDKKFYSKSKYMKMEEFLDEVVKDKNIQSQLWQKIFKRDLYKDLQFPENIMCMEDYAILHKLILKSNKIYYLAQKLYFYRVRKNSLVTRIDLKKSYQCYLIAKQRFNFLQKKGYQITPNGYLMQALGVCIQFHQVNQKSIYKEYMNICKDDIKLNIKKLLLAKEIDIKLKLKYLLCYLNCLKPIVKVYYYLQNRGQ